MRSRSKSAALLAAVLLAGSAGLPAQVKPTWSADEQPLFDQVRGLRQKSDRARGDLTRELALEIRRLPATPNKVLLAEGLASLATEGDFGRATLQEVATTLSEALREQPVASENGEPARPYMRLAMLVRYEQVQVSLDTLPFAAAFAKLESAERRRASAEIDLRDLHGKEWKLSGLRGKVVLVNFFATWCPPCRKESPDLDALYARFRKKGLAILAISAEEAGKVAAFAKAQTIRYPILLDTGGQVHELFGVEGIPKSFVYDRDGKIVATAIDMRTQKQFLAMLAKAGLK
jgi:peroxiredoxin